jgi:Vitamin B6 photo-protection and homoeostasis
MAATLLFTYAASSTFRTDVKRWRIFADVMVDLGITFEYAATMFPRSFFLPVICLGNICKAVCGVAAGASGGSINLHWSTGSDISDINAKFGAQHTVTGAIGLVSAGVFARSVDRISSTSLWVLYVTLTVLHIFANLRCMKLISFDYVNTIRMDMIIKEFFAISASTRLEDCTSTSSSLTRLRTPQEIAKREPLFFGMSAIKRVFSPPRDAMKRPFRISRVYFGVAFDEYSHLSGKPLEFLRSEVVELQSGNGSERTDSTLTGRSSDGYLISSGCSNLQRPNAGPLVVVCFLADVTPLQQAKAYFHANLLGRQLQSRIDQEHHREQKSRNKSPPTLDLPTRLEVESQTRIILDDAWGDFLARSAEAGWDLNRSELQSSGFEILKRAQ